MDAAVRLSSCSSSAAAISDLWALVWALGCGIGHHRADPHGKSPHS